MLASYDKRDVVRMCYEEDDEGRRTAVGDGLDFCPAEKLSKASKGYFYIRRRLMSDMSTVSGQHGLCCSNEEPTN